MGVLAETGSEYLISSLLFRKIGFHVTDALFIINFSLSEENLQIPVFQLTA